MDIIGRAHRNRHRQQADHGRGHDCVADLLRTKWTTAPTFVRAREQPASICGLVHLASVEGSDEVPRSMRGPMETHICADYSKV